MGAVDGSGWIRASPGKITRVLPREPTIIIESLNDRSLHLFIAPLSSKHRNPKPGAVINPVNRGTP